jgi:hypothetical protein
METDTATRKRQRPGSDPEVYSGQKSEEGPNHGFCPAFPLSGFTIDVIATTLS